MNEKNLNKLTTWVIHSVTGEDVKLDEPVERVMAFLNEYGFLHAPDLPEIPGLPFKVRPKGGGESYAVRTVDDFFVAKGEHLCKEELLSQYELIDWFEQ